LLSFVKHFFPIVEILLAHSYRCTIWW